MKYITLLVLFFSTNLLANTEWENIKLTYDYHFKGMGGIEKLSSPDGEKIIDKVQEFISDPKNRKFVNSEDGKILINNHAKYLNFLSAKKTLDECSNNKNSTRKLEESIVSGILEANTDIAGCEREAILAFQSISEIFSDVDKITQTLSKPKFQDELYEKSLINTLGSYLENHYRYNQDFFKDGFDKDQANKVFYKFCSREMDCSPEMREKIKKKIISFGQKERKEIKKLTAKEVQNRINFKIHKLNEKLGNIKVNREEGFFSDYFENGVNVVLPYMLDSGSPDLKNETTQEQFNDYIGTYLSETAKEEGLLMHTESIRDVMGNMRTINDDEHIDEDTHFTTSTYKFEKHEEVDLGDTEDAIEDMYDGIDEQISKLKKQNIGKKIRENKLGKLSKGNALYNREAKLYKKDRDKDINFLVKTNPKAVSQVLAEDPSYASLVCSALINIDKQDANASGNGDAFLWGGIALGVAGLLTGGLAWIGAGVLSAGAVATLGTVTSGLIIASTASSVVGGTISYTEAYHMNKEASEIENGILSGSSYMTSTEQMRDHYLSYKNALYDASINSAMSIAGLGALGALNKLGKSKALIKKGDSTQPLDINETVFENLNYIYGRISKNPQMAKMFEEAKQRLGPNGQSQIDEFLGQLSYVSKEARDKFFLTLSTMGHKPEQLKKLIEKSSCSNKH